MEEYKPVVNTLPEVTQLLLGQERHCQGLLDVLQPDQSQGPQVVSLCGAPGAGMLLPTLPWLVQNVSKHQSNVVPDSITRQHHQTASKHSSIRQHLQ